MKKLQIDGDNSQLTSMNHNSDAAWTRSLMRFEGPTHGTRAHSLFEIYHAHHSWLSDGYVELGYRIDIKKGGKSFSFEQGGGLRNFEL